MSKEHLLVAGSGITGLAVALTLAGDGRRLTLFDRDPAPAEMGLEEAFAEWPRKGATQLRHSHAFLGRLNRLLRTRHPALVHELEAAGARLVPYRELLVPPLERSYRFQAGDEDLCLFFSRRTTLEYVMRRYVARLDGVTLVADAGVRGILCDRDDTGRVRVNGLAVERGGAVEEWRGDAVIDASGRNTTFPDWLRAQGCRLDEEETPCGILYFTRHYRLREGTDEPARDGTPGAGDLGYIKYGVFPADNRHFSVTLALPEIETALRKAVLAPHHFDAICTAIPGAARWIEPSRSEAVSAVYAMGSLVNLWRHFLVDGEPVARNFFALGDAAIRTNPLYGRGCSLSFVQAELLHEAFRASHDMDERARHLARRREDELRPFFKSMAKLDLDAIRRAQRERDPAYRPRLKARLLKSFIEDALTPATRGDMTVARASARAFHMLADPEAWLRKPGVLARLLWFWVLPRSLKQARAYYPPEFGPGRGDMLATLGLGSS